MAWNRVDNWKRPQQETGRQRRRAGRVKREGLRLLCAGLIFVFCWFGTKCVPGVRNRMLPVLESLLTCSCDFEEAVRCFSARMEGDGDMGTALEEFCVTAFAVQTTASPVANDPNQLALQAALQYPETPTAGF